MVEVPNTFAGKAGEVPADQLDENFSTLGTAIEEKSSEAKTEAVDEVRGEVPSDRDTLEKLNVQVEIARQNASDAYNAGFVVGTTETLPDGEDATVTIDNTPTLKTFNFGLPRGEKGDTGSVGPTPDLQVGTVTVGPDGEAAITITGTPEEPVLNFVIPEGPQGQQGDVGPQGPPGANLNERGPWSGATAYVFKDLVAHEGSSFYAKRDNTGVEPPSSGSSADWQVFAQKGVDGTSPDVSIGTTTTLTPGSSATVVQSGTQAEPVFSFGIPAGADGADGIGFATDPYGEWPLVVTGLPETEGDPPTTLLRASGDRIEHRELDGWRDRLDTSLPATMSAGENGLTMTGEGGQVAWHVGDQLINHPETNDFRFQLSRARIPDRDTALDAVQAWAQNFALFGYGQSLMCGRESLPVASVLPQQYALRFAGGVRPTDSGLDSAVNFARLSIYFEQRSTWRRNSGAPATPQGWTSRGDTPMGGALRMIHQLLLEEDGIDLVETGQKLIGAVQGQDGTSIKGLSPDSIVVGPPLFGQFYYNDLMDCVNYGQSLSAASSRSYQAGSLFWVHGNEDYDLNTGYAAYRAAMVALQAKFQADVQAATSSTAAVPWIMSQNASHLNYGRSNPFVALAQLNLANEANFIMAAPEWMLAYYTDHVHLLPSSEVILGAYLGIAAKRLHWDGVKFVCCKPLASSRHGNVLTVRFNVPGERLVLDDSISGPASLPNYGVQVVTSADASVTVNSVSQISRDTIQIVCATAPGANCKVRHAWVGDAYRGLGGIRDDQGERIVFDRAGMNIPMHNWAPTFEEIVA